MAEYIDRQKLIQDIEDSVRFSSRNGVSAEMRGAHKIVDRIISAPTVDAVEVVHGRWETQMLGDDVGYKCSACHLTSDWDTPYCPQCGALMDGDTDD